MKKTWMIPEEVDMCEKKELCRLAERFACHLLQQSIVYEADQTADHAFEYARAFLKKRNEVMAGETTDEV